MQGSVMIKCDNVDLHYYFYKLLYTGVSARMLIKCSTLIIIFLGRAFLFLIYFSIIVVYTK